eukprot:4398738-Amphidinium_carterae.2
MELSALSADTSLSEPLQAQLLLRFSGLSHSQRTQVVSAANNTYKLTEIEKGMRTLFGEWHLQDRARAAAYTTTPYKSNKGGKGKRKGKVQGKSKAYAAEAYEHDEEQDYGDVWGEEGADYTEADYPYEAFAAMEYAEEDVGGEEIDVADEGALDYLDAEDPETVEAYAVAAQKGKGKGRAKPSSGSVPDSGVAMSNNELPFKGTLNIGQRAERAKKLQLLKSRSKCVACGRYGHWAGDAECQQGGKGRGKAAGKGGKAYFAVADEIMEDVVQQSFAVKSSSKRSFLETPCEHCLICSHDIVRGANGKTRHLACTACDSLLVQVSRRGTHMTVAGAGLWQYIMIAILFHPGGQRLRMRAFFRVHGRPANPAGRLALEHVSTGTARAKSQPRIAGTMSTAARAAAEHSVAQRSGTLMAGRWCAISSNKLWTGSDPDPELEQAIADLPVELVWRQLQHIRTTFEELARARRVSAMISAPTGEWPSSSAEDTRMQQGYMAVGSEETGDVVSAEKGDIVLGVLDTACTSTMHGDAW